MDELRVYIWWVGGELFQKLVVKVSTLILPIWISECCRQVRECVVKISAYCYSLVATLLIVQLSRISLGKILVILLSSTKLRKAGSIYCIIFSKTFRFRLRFI